MKTLFEIRPGLTYHTVWAACADNPSRDIFIALIQEEGKPCKLRSRIRFHVDNKAFGSADTKTEPKESLLPTYSASIARLQCLAMLEQIAAREGYYDMHTVDIGLDGAPENTDLFLERLSKLPGIHVTKVQGQSG